MHQSYPTLCVPKAGIPFKIAIFWLDNGFKEDFLDIDKRNLISRFYSQDILVLECIPVSIFSWQRKWEYKTEPLIREIMDATKIWFLGTSENHVISPEDKDVDLWLLISTNAGPGSECYQSSEQEYNIGGCWRFALLVNNTVLTFLIGLKQESHKGFVKEVVGDDHVLQLLFSQLFEFASKELIDVVIPRHIANATHMEGVVKVLEKYRAYYDQVMGIHGLIPNSHEPIKVLALSCSCSII